MDVTVGKLEQDELGLAVKIWRGRRHQKKRGRRKVAIEGRGRPPELLFGNLSPEDLHEGEQGRSALLARHLCATCPPGPLLAPSGSFDGGPLEAVKFCCPAQKVVIMVKLSVAIRRVIRVRTRVVWRTRTRFAAAVKTVRLPRRCIPWHPTV